MAKEQKVNIMSVEVAIKRELAYRAKLARLYPEHDWKKELLPLEVPSSTGSLSQNPSSPLLSEPCSFSVVNNLNRFPNSSFQNLSSTPTVQGEGSYRILDVASHTSQVQNQDPSPPSWPNLDMVVASTPSVTKANTTASSFLSLSNNQLQTGPGPYPAPDMPMVASHQVPFAIADLEPYRVENWNLNSSLCPNVDMALNHSLNWEKATATSFHSLPYERSQPLHIGNTNWFCQVCKVSCQSSYNYKQHVRGHKHKAKLQLLQISRNVGGLNKPQPVCNLCRIWCTDENSLELHFKGQKHKAKLKEIELGQEGTAPQQLWCEFCQVPCVNEDTFRMHLEGKNHAARLHATRKNNRAM